MMWPCLDNSVAWRTGSFRQLTSSLGCANRSCGPPTPGRRLLSGVRRCRRGSAGGPLGPDEAPEGSWGHGGVPKGSEHQSCTDTGRSSDLSDDYMLRAALKGTFFFGENQHASQNQEFVGFIVTRQTALPIQIVSKFCAGVWYGMVDSKSYCTVVKTHRDETFRVTDLSPG